MKQALLAVLLLSATNFAHATNLTGVYYNSGQDCTSSANGESADLFGLKLMDNETFYFMQKENKISVGFYDAESRQLSSKAIDFAKMQEKGFKVRMENEGATLIAEKNMIDYSHGIEKVRDMHVLRLIGNQLTYEHEFSRWGLSNLIEDELPISVPLYNSVHTYVQCAFQKM